MNLEDMDKMLEDYYLARDMGDYNRAEQLKRMLFKETDNNGQED